MGVWKCRTGRRHWSMPSASMLLTSIDETNSPSFQLSKIGWNLSATSIPKDEDMQTRPCLISARRYWATDSSSLANPAGSQNLNGAETPAMSSGSKAAALTTRSLLNFFNLAWVTWSSFANSSLAKALMEGFRAAAKEVSANFSIGLEGTPFFLKVFCMALTDIAGTRRQDTLIGDAPSMLMAGVSTSRWVSRTGLKNTPRQKPITR